MNSLRPQSPSRNVGKSTENPQQIFGVISQLQLDLDRAAAIPGSLNDSHIIRAVLIDSIRKSGKSRATIAEEMTYLIGREITERQLNGFTAESKEDYRFPAELERAFCKATGDNRLLSCRLELAGLHVISDEEKVILEFGRQHLIRSQAEEQIAILARRLHGRVA